MYFFQTSDGPQTQSIRIKAVTQPTYFQPTIVNVEVESRKNVNNTVISDFPIGSVSVSTVCSLHI